MKRTYFVFIGLFIVLIGCESQFSFTEKIDHYFFKLSGGTIFSDPGQLTTKELHFDTGSLLGQEIIVEGDVVKTGKYHTHLVITDGSGRMLVVLTQIGETEKIFQDDFPKKLKVLGTLERGKKGLPYILAKSINTIEKEQGAKTMKN